MILDFVRAALVVGFMLTLFYGGVLLGRTSATDEFTVEELQENLKTKAEVTVALAVMCLVLEYVFGN